MFGKTLKILSVIICFAIALVGFMIRLPSSFRHIDKELHAAFYFCAAAFLHLIFSIKSPLKHVVVFALLFVFGMCIEAGQELYNKFFHVHFHGRFDPEDVSANLKGLILFSMVWILFMLIKAATKKNEKLIAAENFYANDSMPLYRALNFSPMIPSYNIAETMAFFTGYLKFSVIRSADDYVILCKDQSTVHLLRAGDDIGEMDCYLEADNVDAIWKDLQSAGIEKIKAPFNREYGMREIHLVIPQTKTLLFIGQVIKRFSI